MTESITYAQLDAALQQLGFQKSAPAGEPIGYRHEASETIVLFRKHRPSDIVPAGSLAATRKLLVDRGLVKPSEWDAMLRPVAA